MTPDFRAFPSDPPVLTPAAVHALLRHAAAVHAASDVQFIPGYPARAAILGELQDLMVRPLSQYDTAAVVVATRGVEGESLVRGGEAVSYSTEIPLQEGEAIHKGSLRFRTEAAACEYLADTAPRVVFRYLPSAVPALENQNPGLPPDLQAAVLPHRGMVLVVGGTGTGKSTLLAGIIRRLGHTRADTILTFEQPIEFVYRPRLLLAEGPWRATVSQSEIGRHFASWSMALRSALRSGPQVLLVGEMRDAESITAAVEFVRTGHLLYSTMHVDGVAAIPTEIAARTGNDASMLARVTGVLSAAVYQRLAKRADGTGRVAVREYLIMTHALRRTLLPLSAAEAEACLADAMKRAGTDLASEATRLADQGVITADEALRVTGGLL